MVNSFKNNCDFQYIFKVFDIQPFDIDINKKQIDLNKRLRPEYVQTLRNQIPNFY